MPSGLARHQAWSVHQEPGVAVEPLEHVDPAENQRISASPGENTRRGRPTFHQTTMVAKIAAAIFAPCAALIQSMMPADPR